MFRGWLGGVRGYFTEYKGCSGCILLQKRLSVSAQLKRILWDRGAFRGCLGGVQEVSRGISQSIRGVQDVFCDRNGSG